MTVIIERRKNNNNWKDLEAYRRRLPDCWEKMSLCVAACAHVTFCVVETLCLPDLRQLEEIQGKVRQLWQKKKKILKRPSLKTYLLLLKLYLVPKCVHAMSFLLLLLLCAANGVLVRSRNERERCELLSKHMLARMSYYDNERQRTIHCRDRIRVQTCEGSCRSRTIPAVDYARGFQRLCRCCFETSTRMVDVYLGHCFLDGERLPNGRTFRMKEPTSCSCSRC